MWGKSKKEKQQTKVNITSLIGQGTEVKGDIEFSGGLHIDGVVKGNISAPEDSGSALTLSEQGKIEGDVRVSNIILNGEVNGNVYALEHIELAVNARVNGNVYYQLIEMEMGAAVNGSLVHAKELQKKKAEVAQQKKRAEAAKAAAATKAAQSPEAE